MCSGKLSRLVGGRGRDGDRPLPRFHTAEICIFADMRLLDGAMLGKLVIRQRPMNADLASIRAAIMKRKVARFLFRRQEYMAEPHLLGRARKTGAFYLKAYDLGTAGWKYFTFADLREFEATAQDFTARPAYRDREQKISVVDTAVPLE